MTLSLFLLGCFQAKLQDRALDLTSRKAQALLAYLAIEDARPHYREALSGLLWPDRPDRTARGSLRQALQDLRRAIGDDAEAAPLFIISRETIQLNPEAGSWVDAAAFEKLAAVDSRQISAGHEATEEEALRSAVALYRGPFLEGFSLGDSPAFEEWLLLKREQFGRQVLLALRALAVLCEGRAAYTEALAFARRAIELEPWHEEAHRQIMRLLTLSGQRNAAMGHYHRYEQMLERELGVPPDPETVALYERIRGKTFTVPRPRSAHPEGVEPSVQATAGGDESASPLHAAPVGGTPFPTFLVARKQELARLEGHLVQALAGQGCVLLVTGEAGSGKTALVEGFGRQAMAAHRDLVVALGRCSAYGGAGDAYQPFREILWALTGNPEALLSAEHAQRLQAALPVAFEALVQQGSDMVHLLARHPSLVARARAGAPRGATWPARFEALVAQAFAPGAASVQEVALCEQGTRVLRSIASRSPLLIILDDLQWADAPSLDMLFYLGRHLQGSCILIVGTFRSNEADLHPASGQHALTGIADEFRRQWGDIWVDLAQAEGRTFVDAYLDSWPNRLDARFRETLARHTGGNALFMVEMVRAMQECGSLLRDRQGYWVESPNLAWGQLPPRVEGAISQRIGQLTPVQKELLEIASVEGEEFHAEVLARVRGLSVEAVVASLSGPLSRQAHLVMPGSMVRAGKRPLALYRFRHGLFQSYLYGRLDAVARAHLHGAVGAALQELYGEQETLLAGQLARHFEVAGRASLAVGYLLAAGQQAAQIGAHREAIACYKRALTLLEALPAASERTECEFALQLALDHSLLAIYGWGAPERFRTLDRAYELGQQLGQTSFHRMRALNDLAELSMGRGERERAFEIANELLAAAEHARNAWYIATAHGILAICCGMQGALAQGWGHALQALAAGVDSPPVLAAENSWARVPRTGMITPFLRLVMGYPDQARQQMERVITGLVRGAGHDMALVQNVVAMFYALVGDDDLARQWAESSLQMAEDQEMLETRGWSERILGWVDTRLGDAERGIARIQATTSAGSVGGTAIFRPFYQGLSAEAYLAGGERGHALQAIEEALAQVKQTGFRIYEAELWRLRGQAVPHDEQATASDVHQQAPIPLRQAEGYFRQAIEIARQQGARLWELRATISLARLCMGEGRSQEAHEALAAIYVTFSEGFDTPDLIEARTLLQSLGVQAGRPEQSLQCIG